jgi:hypothetical protein
MLKYTNFFILFFFLSTIFATDNSLKISFQALDSSSNAWWLKNNNYGISNDNFQSSIYYSNTNEKRKMSADFIFQKNKITFKEIFVNYYISDKEFFKFGKYYRNYSTYLNDDLSSGHLILSNNAEALKKIGFFSSKKFKNKNLEFNFGINNGLFDKNEIYVEAPFFHEKFLSLDFSKQSYAFSIGFIHAAMWGGSISNLGKQPSSIKDFFKVFIAADGPLLEGEPHANALGNHIGIWDFHFLFKKRSYNYNLYYQHIFEDTSGLRFANKSDGLWGVEVINNYDKSSILLEYLNTSKQDSNPPYVNEGYYNHYQYRLGWSYKGYSLGNSFIDPLNIIPLEVTHLGLQKTFFDDVKMIYKASRRIDISDKIKYKLSLSKSVDFGSLKKFQLFIANSDDAQVIGLGLSFMLK